MLFFIFTPRANATWSVVKLEPESRSIVVAGASCSYMVYGIAGVIPGKGVAIVQAASSADARAYAVEQIANDKALSSTLAHIVDTNMITDADMQQYALLSFAEWNSPVTFTGKNTSNWHGAKSAPGISVQANTMVSAKIVDAAFSVMEKPAQKDSELIEQAYQALLNGSRAGGDSRCQSSSAATAFISLYRATDNVSTPYLNLVIYGLEPGTVNAVDKLGELLRVWQKTPAKPQSTQQFVIPGG